MKTFKIFLASSGTLAEERKAIKDFIGTENNRLHKHDIFIHLVVWEELLKSFSGTRIQDYFNKEMLACDMVIALFLDKVGEFTLEEFHTAWDEFKKGNLPKYLYAYFSKAPIGNAFDIDYVELGKVQTLRKEIEKEQQIYCTYTSIADLKNQISDQLKLIEELQPSDGRGILPPPPAPATSLTIPASYIKWIDTVCKHMEIEKLVETENRGAVTALLPELFIPLYAYEPLRKGEQSRSELEREPEKKPRNIEELIHEYQTLLIEAQAGSGKTTLFKHLTYSIIHGSQSGWERTLPVLVFLRDLRKFLDTNSTKPLSAEEIVAGYFREKSDVLEMKEIMSYCGRGKVLLLIDGLDELSAPQRRVIIDAFASFQHKHACCSISFSGRPHSFTEARSSFHESDVTILTLDREQQADFTHRFFKSIYIDDETKAEVVTEGMLGDLRSNAALENFGYNPLMLTAVCLLYHANKKLPNQRAELYKKLVDTIVANKFRDDEVGKVNEFLVSLAFDMQRRNVKTAEHDELLRALKKVEKRREHEGATAYGTRIEQLFAEIEPRCGLLTTNGNQYSFWHSMFQEYLAARRILETTEPYNIVLAPYWGKPWCREVVKLAISYLSLSGKVWPAKIVKEAMPENGSGDIEKALLAAEAVVDIFLGLREEGLTKYVIDRLWEIIGWKVGRKTKARAGEIIGLLGDERDLKEFVPIRGGRYTLKGLGDVTLKDFEIGRYPVTNQWYEEFVTEAKGYTQKEYWSKKGWQWRESKKIATPEYWDKREWRSPNSPVVGVSWYEAEAFMHWLTKSRHDGRTYRLAMEEEWQAAAAGKEEREYPWGEKFDPEICNCREGNEPVEKTSPVGIFKEANTPEGIADMAGNVWEWTESLYKEGESYRVLRGGSWGYVGNFLRSAYRYWNPPDFRNYVIGFRCVCSRY
jgi:energy-coupling factor transporter ATP-binding protein EcfA2